MAWIAAVIAICVVIYWAVRSPGFRIFLASVVVLIGGTIYWFVQKSQEDERKAYSLISPAEIKITNLQYTFDAIGSGLTITGLIHNSSSYTASEVTLETELFDCPSAVKNPPEGCTSIGQDKSVDPLVTVPPGGTRSLDAHAYMSNMPPD